MDKISQKTFVLEAINYDIHDQNYVHDIAQCEIIFCCFLVKNAKKNIENILLLQSSSFYHNISQQ